MSSFTTMKDNKVLDDLSDNLVCCHYMFYCGMHISATRHARHVNLSDRITCFTVLFTIVCESYNFIAPYCLAIP